MARSYMVIVADTEGGVLAQATAGRWTLLKPVRAFADLDTLDDGTLGPTIGRVFIKQEGFVALAFKDG